MKVWYCRRGDGESYGRVIELDVEPLVDPESCPVCEYPSEYHGCGEMQLVPADAESQCPNCKFVYEVKT